MMSTQRLRVSVYRGSDAFMYLPLYIAMHHRIFDQDPGQLNVEMRTSSARGDKECLSDMSDMYDRDGSDIAIAVCDPMAIFEMPDSRKFVVVGTLIKQPTFWLIQRRNVGQIRELICLDANYSTGYYLGRTYAGQIGAKTRPRDFGNEIDAFIADTASDHTEPIAVLSADVLGIAKALTSDDSIRVEIDFQDYPKYQNFMTVSFVTLREYAERNSSEISHFLHGIQRAISMLAYAPSLAEKLCIELSSDAVFSRQMQIGSMYSNAEELSDREAAKLVSMIRTPGKLLSIDMTTTMEDWRAAVTVKAAVDISAENVRQDRINQFENYVLNDCSIDANRLYMEDPLTFTAYRNAWHEIDPTAQKREMIGNIVVGLWMLIFLIFAVNHVTKSSGVSTFDLFKFMPTDHSVFPLAFIGFVVFSVISVSYSRSGKPFRVRFFEQFRQWFGAHLADGCSLIAFFILMLVGAIFTNYGWNVYAWIAATFFGFIPFAREIYGRYRRWQRK